jgi:hypothetical protein
LSVAESYNCADPTHDPGRDSNEMSGLPHAIEKNLSRRSAALAAVLAGCFLGGPTASGDDSSNIPQQAQLVDDHVGRGWTESGVTPAQAATAGEWCRRVYLDVIGRTPTVAELDRFTADRGADKKQRLVERLLGDEYVVDYARYWSTLWTNLLIGRAGGTDDDELTSREGMQAYLRESFAVNKPYDALVRELITATGGTRPDADDFNGATNFLAGKLTCRASDRQDRSAIPWRAGAVYAMPQSPIQRGQAEPVLGAQRVLPADPAAPFVRRADDCGRAAGRRVFSRRERPVARKR